MNANTRLLDWQRFDGGGHPDYVDLDSLDIHVVWCVWHEGLRVYQDALKINEFRLGCIDKQRKNNPAAEMISAASNNQLHTVIDSMMEYFQRPENGGFKMVNKHLSWVLNHEEKRPKILGLLDQGNFGEIRAIYQSAQEHNPHVHYLIQAVDDRTLERLIDTMRQ